MLLVKTFSMTAAMIAFSAVAQAGSVMIKPGQCVIVGTTEVCATMPTQQACEQVKPDHIFACIYDMHPHPEMPGLKTYAVVRTTVNQFGKKTETVIKNYGISDKEGCEADADKKNAP